MTIRVEWSKGRALSFWYQVVVTVVAVLVLDVPFLSAFGLLLAGRMSVMIEQTKP